MIAEVLSVEKFGISKTLGFLSDKRPLPSFPNSYFSPWDELVADLPNLISSHTISNKVAELPVLSSSNLSTELDFRRAYVVLAFLIHGYIWGGSKDGRPLGEIPPQLAEPFLVVCDHLGLQPVLSYAGLCLWNWSTTGESQAVVPDLVRLQSLATFTGTRGEDAFYHVPVLTEAEGGPLVSSLLRAVAAAEISDTVFVTNALHAAADTFIKMGIHMQKLYSVLDADLFYHGIRTFVGAGSGKSDNGLTRGVVFQNRDGSKKEVNCIAGTAGQSSLFQFLDLVLGVEHKKPERAKETFFEEMRAYMPRQHREFLSLVSKLQPLRKFVQENSQDEELVDAYDSCMRQLRLWRGKHIAVVSKYIVRPARQAAENAAASHNGHENEEDKVGGGKDGELRGTGGSALIPFLRQTRDDTVGAKHGS